MAGEQLRHAGRARVQFHKKTKTGNQRKSARPLHVLVCPDQPSWAFDNIADNIALYAGHNRISKLYMQDVIGNEHLFFEAIFLKRIDLCHVFWREDLFYLLHPHTITKAGQHLGLDYETMVRAINSCAFTTSVYDHLFTEEADIRKRRSIFSLIDGYTVSSGKLEKLYSNVPGLPPPDITIPDGVDTVHFSPRGKSRGEKGLWSVGWVGNSAWGKQSQGFDVKGYQRIFRPMMTALQADGFAVEESVADPQIKRIAFEDMPEFYRQLDVFVCTSVMEGTPNPVLEAMACGIPVVSSDVGIVTEAVGPKQKRFVVENLQVDNFVQAVAELLQDGQLREDLGAENRQQAQAWSWETKTKDWWPFWISVVERAMEPRNAIRRELCFLSRNA